MFACLSGDRRVWAVSAIHGEQRQLATLHARMRAAMRGDDRVVYLGNYFGRGPAIRETLDEILLFRRALIARPDGDPGDVVFLRGSQEEMLQKLLQLQFASDPVAVLEWVLEQGVGATLAAYGIIPGEGFQAAREGTVALSRWTGRLREAIARVDGHRQLLNSLRHAAYLEDRAILFVHAGLDPDRPFTEQGDSLWWGGFRFRDDDARPYDGFRRVVRGFDRRGGGQHFGTHAVTLDAGCGFGGPLVAGCFEPTGELAELLEV